MSQTARVTSIDTIKEFRATLCRFGDDVKNGLGAMEMEVRRTLEWLLHDRPMFWQNQIKRRKEDLAEAESELFRRRLQAGPGREVHDSDQKERVRIARRRLEEAEQKLVTVKKWGPLFQHAVEEYLMRARPTGDMIEGDLRHAIEMLDRMTAALDAYLATAPPPTLRADPATATAEATSAASAPTAFTSAAQPAPVEGAGSARDTEPADPAHQSSSESSGSAPESQVDASQGGA